MSGFPESKSREKLCTQGCNIRPTDDVLIAWTEALLAAFNTKFLQQVGSKNPAKPNGWYVELSTQ